jgi:hypothetical protein
MRKTDAKIAAEQGKEHDDSQINKSSRREVRLKPEANKSHHCQRNDSARTLRGRTPERCNLAWHHPPR